MWRDGPGSDRGVDGDVTRVSGVGRGGSHRPRRRRTLFAEDLSFGVSQGGFQDGGRTAGKGRLVRGGHC